MLETTTTDRDSDMGAMLEEARNDLLFYTQACNPSYIASKFHVFLAGKLQQVASGKIKRLIINTPPRHGKSQMVSVEFPTWLLGNHPDKKIVLGSYAQDLSMSHSKMSRARMQSEEYQAIFDTRIADGEAAANEWKTARGGMYKAVGVGGGLTGRGADCLLPGTVILTERGCVKIESLAITPSPGKVLAYDDKSKRLVWRKITAIGSRKADGFYRITTAAGRVVEATAEHPFFTGIGYTIASKLAAGQPLLCAVRKGVRDGSVQCQQEYEARAESFLLRQRLRVQAFQREARISSPPMPELWRDARPNEAALHGRLPGGSLCKTESLEGRAEAVACLPAMQHCLQEERHTPNLLHGKMRGLGALAQDDEGGKPRLEEWRDGTKESGGAEDSDCAAESSHQKGWPGVRGVRLPEQSGGSPRQRRPVGQRDGEHGDALPPMPHEMARGGEIEAETDFVALVERVCEPAVVFNIQVEGTENFFANGILTHNCLLIDDPTKDFQEAHSATIRENVWNWFWSVAYTRLHPGAAVVILMTRWHTDDLVGRLLDPERIKAMEVSDEESRWEVINLPAMSHGHGDALGRPHGDALFPERYPVERLRSIKASVGSYVWSALYDGNPVVRGGNYIPVSNIQVVDAAPDGLRWVRFWDLATSEKKSSDHTSSIAAALGPDGTLYLRDWIDGQWEWPMARARIKQTAELERIPVGVEAVAGFKTAFANLIEVLPPYITCREYGADKDKLTRALPWIALVDRSKVALVRGEWNMDFIMQAEQFPSGKLDDGVDSVSGCWGMLQTVFNHPVPVNVNDRFRAAMTQRRTRALAG